MQEVAVMYSNYWRGNEPVIVSKPVLKMQDKPHRKNAQWFVCNEITESRLSCERMKDRK